jgi:integrative and conjugative element protein (TIGR02256 family)
VNVWTGKAGSGRYRISIRDAALASMDRFCTSSAHLETGGILLGHYADDGVVAVVEEATAPPNDSGRGGSWFRRGVAGLREELARRWRQPKRTFYVGEWHFHPAATIVPSPQDFAQMKDIAASSRYQCREPLLVIVGGEMIAGRRSLRAFVCPVGEPPLEFESAPPRLSAEKP